MISKINLFTIILFYLIYDIIYIYIYINSKNKYSMAINIKNIYNLVALEYNMLKVMGSLTSLHFSFSNTSAVENTQMRHFGL